MPHSQLAYLMSCIKIFAIKHKGLKPLRRYRKDNIKIDLEETGMRIFN
jgi:hypothetical protein